LSIINKHIRVSSSTKSLSEIRKFVRGVAGESGFNKNSVEEIVLAVDEACTNIIKHAYKNSPDNSIEIDARFDGTKLTFTLIDYGEKFNPDYIAPPDLEEKLKEKKSGGLGIHLMRRLMDEVIYEVANPKFNKLTLVKKL
jgi:serine/threonine-protein kinase RsbW